ncbi:MAG: MFS transporter, partial [Actinomycetales bacterium]
GMVVAVDRGRFTLDVDGVAVYAVKARELGRKGVVVGDHVSVVGDVTGAQDTLARIVRVSERALLGSVILAGLGFTWLWFTAEGAVMILALTITGVGMGLHIPLGIARTMRASGGQPDRAAGLVNAGMAVTSGIAPFALAGLADGWGVHQAFLLLPLFFCVGLTLLILKPVPEEPLRPDAIDPNTLSASR